jgi:hypothetical protein
MHEFPQAFPVVQIRQQAGFAGAAFGGTGNAATPAAVAPVAIAS